MKTINTYGTKHDSISTLTTIIGIRNTDSTTNDTSSLEGSIITFIAGVDNGGWIDETIANDTFAITFFA